MKMCTQRCRLCILCIHFSVDSGNTCHACLMSANCGLPMFNLCWLHNQIKGAAVFADGLAAAVDNGMGSITHIVGSRHYLN